MTENLADAPTRRPVLAIVAEPRADERRIAATPDTVARLVQRGFDVVVQLGAGIRAGFDDDAYRAAGASTSADAEELWRRAQIGRAHV